MNVHKVCGGSELISEGLVELLLQEDQLNSDTLDVTLLAQALIKERNALVRLIELSNSSCADSIDHALMLSEHTLNNVGLCFMACECDTESNNWDDWQYIPLTMARDIRACMLNGTTTYNLRLMREYSTLTSE